MSLETAPRLIRENAILKEHTDTVRSVTVSLDSSPNPYIGWARIVTGSRDSTARV